jgi:uncharacterized membrane protein
MKLKPTKYLILTLVFFGIIYSLISLVNHYTFRTYALDLGLYTNALYKYAHFKLADSMMFKMYYECLLADHFDLYLVIFAPLVYIFGTYTLLVVQITSILAGGAGVFMYFKLTDSKHEYLAHFATLFFFLFYGIYSALSFDYHSNVVAAMIIPWFFYFFKRRKYLVSLLLTVLVLVAKENMALWLIFICLGMALEYRKDKMALTFLSVFILISLIYFILIINVIMPKLSNSNQYNLFSYSILGKTPFEAIKSLLIHPLDNLKILLTNHNNSINGDYVKIEMLILVILSGAYLLFLKPRYLIMLIPIFFQKLYHDNYLVWGIGGQYSIEFAPILAIGIFSSINEFKEKKYVNMMTAIVILGVLLSTIRVMDNTVFYTQKSRIRIYQAAHYKRNYDVRPVHRQLRNIPGDASVSAQSPFVPHLSLRDQIYQFPIVNDAEYIVFSEKEGKYPLDDETFNSTVNQFLGSEEWETWFKSGDLVILKRKATD